MRLEPGDTAPDVTLPALDGGEVTLSEVDPLVHLAFVRYAGCPSCLLHVRRLARRIDEVERAGVSPIVVFHSPVEDLRETLGELPFPVLADPAKEAYEAFGVEEDWRGIVSWATLAESLAGIASGLRWRPSMGHPNFSGLPADLLIGEGREVLASHYGDHFADSWTVDDLLRVVDEVAVDG